MINASWMRCISIAAVSLLAATVASAECRYGVCFGAVGAGERGYAAQVQNLDTAQTAMARLETACRGKCSTMEVFHSGCGVIVQGGRGDHFVGFDASIPMARDKATAACMAEGHRVCVIRARACTR